MYSRDELFLGSLECYFGIYFPRCFATREINTKIQSTPVILRLLGGLPLSYAFPWWPQLTNSGSQIHTLMMLSDNRGTYVSRISTHQHHTSDKSQQATLDFNNYATKLSNHTLRKAIHDGLCVEISQTTSRLDRKQKCHRACVAVFPQSCMSFSVTNSRIAFQITKITTFSTQ